MKITRRKILFYFGTTLAAVSFKNKVKPVQAESIDVTSQISNEQPMSVLKNDKINKKQLYNTFLKAAEGGKEDYPRLLYQGISTSPYEEEIKDYPARLMLKPEEQNLVSASPINDKFSNYPSVGQIPKIDSKRLGFLHTDIKEACICVGSFSEGKLQTKWLGRNALNCEEFWSATKIIALIHLISEIDKKSPKANIESYKIQGMNSGIKSFAFYDLVRDMITYEKKFASSNSLGAMFKRFYPQIQLENWTKKITGNKNLVFRGRYGENPFIDQPSVINPQDNKVITYADSNEPKWGTNQISAYDLTRIISMVGWHNYLPKDAQIPDVKWSSLESLIKVMGNDPARLTDLAIQALGLENDIDSVVIISKEGDGATATRKRTEAVYVALVQLIDRRPQKLGKPAKLISLSMALRGAISFAPRNFDREVVELDARMATEITDIIHRAIQGTLATD